MEKAIVKNEDNGKVWPQIVTILVACSISLSSGILFSWPSPFMVKISNDKDNYDISEAEAALFPTINPVVTIACSFFVPALNDIIGRKCTVMLIAAPQIVAWLLAAFATDIYMFYASRVVFGLADALHFGAIPVYLAEIAVPSVRGKYVNVTAFLVVGHFLANLIGQNFSVRDTSYVCLSFPLVFIIGMVFMPESPYYLIMKNREKEAKKVLQFLRGKDDVDVELTQIKADMKRQMSEEGTWKDLFCIDTNRKAVFASVFMRLSQEFSGVSVVMTYTQLIFEKSNSSFSPEYSSLIVTGLSAILTLISGPISELFGRKKSYLSSLVACALVLLAQASYFYVDQNTTVDIQHWSWFPLVGMVLYIIFSSFGVTCLPTLMMGELFSNSVKAKGVGFNSIMLNIFVFGSNALFYALFEYGLYAPFLCFGTISALSTLFAFYFVPETKGKTLEEIQQSFKKNKP